MAKIKILSVGECSYLHSGYGRYNNGLLTQLHRHPDFHVMEYGLFYNPTFNQADTIPWDFYPNVPPEFRDINSNDKLERWKEWGANPHNNLGGPLYNNILLEAQPDIVIANNDEWVLRYLIDSPFRHFYKLICLFACDSIPQKWEWIESMSRCDAVLTYSNWAKKAIEEQSVIKPFGVASPSCQPNFIPLDKSKIRESFGINPRAKVIGMVARNQVRKQFPSLFEGFRRLLDDGDNNLWLWIHSKYPDGSWSFPELLHEHNVGNRVLFTYACRNCSHIYPSLYQDVSLCPKCRQLSGELPGTNTGVSSEDMCRIYNSFDVMTLLSNCEGYGIPSVESAACGVPIMVTNYSALEDMDKTLGAELIKVQAFQKDILTGQERAIPDVAHLVELWRNFFKKPEAIRRVMGIKARRMFEMNFGWEKTAAVWESAIKSVYEPSNWKSPLNVHIPAPMPTQRMNHIDYAKYLIRDVAGLPNRLNSIYENELIRNLTYGCRANVVSNGISTFYNAKMAYDEYRQVGEFRQQCELMRGRVFGL